MSTPTIYARDSTLARVAQVDDWQGLQLVLRWRSPSTWVLDCPDSYADVLVPGAGIVVVEGDETLLSGPVTSVARSWDGVGRLEVAGVDDTVWLWRRICFPEAPALTTVSDAYWNSTGAAETVIRALVAANVGETADVSRRLASLVTTPDYGAGTSVTANVRFDVLGDACAALAAVGGDLGVRVVQDGTSLVLECPEPRDLTASVVFSEELENIRSWSLAEAAPTATFCLVAGQGEGVARTFVSRVDTSAESTWGRIEVFRDARDTNVAAELQQRGDETLQGSAAVEVVGAVPVDTDGFQYGRDWQLGDTVTFAVGGRTVEQTIRETAISWGSSSGGGGMSGGVVSSRAGSFTGGGVGSTGTGGGGAPGGTTRNNPTIQSRSAWEGERWRIYHAAADVGRMVTDAEWARYQELTALLNDPANMTAEQRRITQDRANAARV